MHWVFCESGIDIVGGVACCRAICIAAYDQCVIGRRHHERYAEKNVMANSLC
ncbi:hypothetical protein JCM18918_1620 [Cutibacterium acnes JCM 18918]|nr:hypothetical protein JCM18918_1620 [Cutibacterium acnes JCM 18918]